MSNDPFEMASQMPSAPLTDPLAWTEYALAADLGLDECGICRKECGGGGWFLWRPAGLEHWRCLACLAKTYHTGVLHQQRLAQDAAPDPEWD